MKKLLTLSLVSTIVLSSFAPNLAYATTDQETDELETVETMESTSVTEVVNSSEEKVENEDLLITEIKSSDTEQEVQSSETTNIKRTAAVTPRAATDEITFPASIAEVFPDENFARFMASSAGLYADINQKLPRERFANWTGNDPDEEYLFWLSPSGDFHSLEGMQYLTGIRDLRIERGAIEDGDILTDDFTFLEKLPQLTQIKIDVDAITDESLTVLANMPNLKDLSLDANIEDLTPMLQPDVAIEIFDISENPISSLEPLKAFTNLKELHCNSTEIADLTGVEDLPLEIISGLFNSNLTDISALAKCYTLKEISLGLCALSDLTPLANLQATEKLILSVNQISDLTPLGKLTNLEELQLDYNQVSDLTPLRNLTKMKLLSLGMNQITSIDPLSDMTMLTYTNLMQNQISDIQPLENLNAITEIYLDNNQIFDFSPLQNKQAEISGTGQEVHIKAKRAGDQITLNYPTKSTDGSILTPDTVSDNGTYNSTTNQIIWPDVAAGTEASYTFDRLLSQRDEYVEFRINGTVYVDGIVDNDAPVITADDKISYEVNNAVTEANFLKDIHATTDDGSVVKSNFAKIVDLKTPGTYEVTLTAKDGVGNEAVPVKVTVTITKAPDTTAPVITADDKISYEVNNTVTEADFLKDIQATTDDGSTIESDFAQVVDLNTPGTYEVTLKAKDAAGNEATEVKVTVTVTDPVEDPDDNQKPDDVKPTPVPPADDSKDQPTDTSKDQPVSNPNDPRLNQTGNGSMGTSSNHTVSASNYNRNQQRTNLPSTGAVDSSMYTIFFGLFLLVGSFYGFIQKKKYLKTK